MRPTVRLGEIISFQNGFAFKSENYKNSGAFVMRIKNVQDGYISLEDPQYIGLEDIDLYKDFLLDAGDILMSLTGNIGRVGIIKSEYLPALLNQRVARLKIKEGVDNDFVFYFLSRKSFQEGLMSIASGAAQKNISVKDIQNFEIPLPPLETQKAIVTKLDQIFAELDQTKSEIQKNLGNTDELLKSAYDLKIEELKEKYGLKKLEEICSLITDGSHFSPKTTTKGLPYITVKDIDDEGNIDTENSKKISEEDFAVLVQNGCQPKKGDVLYSKDGTIGKIHLVDDENFVVLSSLAIIRPGKDVKSEYLYQIFHSNFFEKQAVGNKTGAAIKRIVLKTIKSLEIPVPPLSEQEKIVEHLDQVSKEVKALKSQYQSQLDNLEELKKSVLDKAFRGELE